MGAHGICIWGLIALLAAASVQCSKIHEQMTDDEIFNVFRTTRDKVPDYDVVPIKHNMYKRSTSELRLEFTAWGKMLEARLQPSDGILAGKDTPVWVAYTGVDGKIAYRRMRKDIVAAVAGFYDSPANRSVVVVSRSRREAPSFEGVVEGMTVRPLPERFQETMRSKRSAEDANADQALLETRYHVILKSSPLDDTDKMIQLEKQIQEASRYANGTEASRRKRSSPDIIYPSILITTDYQGSTPSLVDSVHQNEIMYQLAFWNAVDLRFRQVNDPKIRLRIAGIIIGGDRASTPYLNDHRTGNEVDVQQGWIDMQKFWHEMGKGSEFPNEAYDMVVTITDSDLVGKDSGGSRIEMNGLAAVNSLCQRGHNVFFAAAIVHDIADYNGILTATHEVAHILGADDDGDGSTYDCDRYFGYIMHPGGTPSPDNIKWSRCSLERIAYYSRNLTEHCASEPADFYPPGPEVNRILPGESTDPDEQCKTRGFQWACTVTVDVCRSLECYYTHGQAFLNGWWCQYSGPAIEGTVCAPHHQCINGVCECTSDNCRYKEKEERA